MTTRLIHGRVDEIFQYTEQRANGCIEWVRSVVCGYGQVKFAGKITAAHRFVYQSIHGPIDASLLVCHRCDNPKCVNPDHLFLGTHQDNSDDMWQKGRGPSRRGIRNPKVKLTPQQVEEIRRIGHSQPYRETAKKYGVTPESISNVVRQKTWTEN